MDIHAAPVAAGRPPALDGPTLCHAFQLTAAEHPEAVALRNPGDAVALTWREYAERVEAIAAGLAAHGVERGDTVGLMVLNRPEFHLLDTATLHLGATPFSVYNTSTAEQAGYQFADAGARVVVTERHFLCTVLAARTLAPSVEHVVLVDGAEDGVVSLDQLEHSGASSFRFAETWQAVAPGDLATVIYTSGTTGPPKGVELTHANALAQCAASAERFPLAPGGRAMSYLPSAHVVDRWTCHWWASMTHGLTVTTVGAMGTAILMLPSVRPTLWSGVPRIWEKLRRMLVAEGVDPAAMSEEERAGVRERLGLDAAEHLGGGAAPMPIDVLTYLDALGLDVAEAWGMSEIGGAGTANPHGAARMGTCGTPLPGVELALAGDDELLVRGPMLMRGYRNDPEGTEVAIDDEGWLQTGDLAHIDDDGYVSIIDRKKDLIITAGGKNMSPGNIEAEVERASPLISHAVAVGDRRPYIVALVMLDAEAAAAFAAEHGLADASPAALAADHDVRTAVSEAIEMANTRLSRVEQVKRFAIVPDEWRAGGPELTPTLKLKRRAVAARYAPEIDALYTS